MSYDRFERQNRRQQYGAGSRHHTLGYWVPLVVTVTAATIGLAAWIWSERRDDGDDDDKVYDTRPTDGEHPPPIYGDVGPGEVSLRRGPGPPQSGESSDAMMARMSRALRRTPSPQQIFDGASRKVAAGVAAAGAAVGGALSSIREEEKDDYADHSRWSEEAESRKLSGNEAVAGAASQSGDMRSSMKSVSMTGSKRKTVAIVISSESHLGSPEEHEPGYHQEQAVSTLSINCKYLER